MSARRLLAIYPFLPYPPNFGGRIRCYHLLDLLRKHFQVELAALTIPEDEPAQVKALGNKVERIFALPSPAKACLSRRQKMRNVLCAVPWELPLRSQQLERLVCEKSAAADVMFLYSARLCHLRHFSRSQVHVVDLDDLPHVTLYRRIKRM